MENVEHILREAARERRRILVNFEYAPGQTYDRELEPYAIEDGELIAYSYLRDEFRTLALADIRRIEVTPRSFEPRRPIDL
jgi:predicted DNA-binding transcriptional regulator YafY